MPVRVPSSLPAVEALRNENIFVIDEQRASSQDIRPLKIAILNLMPLKIMTETDLLRLLSNTPLQIEIDFIEPDGHVSKNTPREHIEAFYKKFDEAAILNMDNPFPQSVEESALAAGNLISGGITYDNILAMEDALNDEDYDVNAFISTKKNRSTLRNVHKIENGVVVESLYDRGANTIDGLPVADLKGMERGNLYAGDFDYMYYGIPFGMSYKIDESAQLSTLKNADGTPVNLFEQELAALRVTMDVAFMIVKDEAFVKLEAGTSQLGTLTVNSTAGTAVGDTKVTVTPTKGDGNSYKYKIGDAAAEVTYKQSVRNWTAWDGMSDITAETGKTITVVECDAEYLALKAGSKVVTAKADE